MKTYSLTFFLASVMTVIGYAAPVVSNVKAAQVPGTHKVQITYDLANDEDAACEVSVVVSNDGGSTYNVVVAEAVWSNDVGSVTPGTGKIIEFDVAKSESSALTSTFSRQLRFKVIADDDVGGGNAPVNFALISAGEFEMGDQSDNQVGFWPERPARTVYVNALYVCKTEVTHQQMADVMNWALGKNYVSEEDGTVKNNTAGTENTLLVLGSGFNDLSWNGTQIEVDTGKATHPCTGVTWYGAVAYCQYLTLKENESGGQMLNVCYNLADWSCDITKNGYRLPTEAEWEKAARDDKEELRYPWGNDIDETYANYNYNSNLGSRKAVGSYVKGRTDKGLDDMIGNVCEWCNDWLLDTYYQGANNNNPKGPVSGTDRVIRGGSFLSTSFSCRVAFRGVSEPESQSWDVGFRLVRRP